MSYLKNCILTKYKQYAKMFIMKIPLNELDARYTEIKNSVDLTLSEYEYQKLINYIFGFSDYFLSKKHKVVIFHGSSDGEISTKTSILHKYFEKDYRFICCFPKTVKEKIGFGKFLWPEFDKETCNFIPVYTKNYVKVFPVSEIDES